MVGGTLTTYFSDGNMMRINQNHLLTKFTAEWSKTSINFLDFCVYYKGVIETDLYTKPTDSHQYLQSTYPL